MMRAVTPETDASAHGVTYVEMIEGLGRTHFACAKINASALSIDTCAGRWKQAKSAGDSVQFMACKGCPIGRCHAGEGDPLKAVRKSGTKRAVVAVTENAGRCCRCGRGGMRLIGSKSKAGVGLICVSCWNREAEYRRGRNAKGTPPKTYVPATPRRVSILVDGTPCWRMVIGQTAREPIARAIRLTEGVQFHDDHPGEPHWNAKAKRWEYLSREHRGHVLLELEERDGSLSYHPAKPDSLRPGEVLATVRAPTTLMCAGLAAEWFTATQEHGDGAAVGSEWLPTDIVCECCRAGQLQARRRSGRIEVQCIACEDSSAPTALVGSAGRAQQAAKRGENWAAYAI